MPAMNRGEVLEGKGREEKFTGPVNLIRKNPQGAARKTNAAQEDL